MVWVDGSRMIEYVLLAVSWYGIGLLSMLIIQCWIDKHNLDERKTWPNHTPSPEVGAQEIWVLGLCGPFILAALVYFVVIIWWLSRDD